MQSVFGLHNREAFNVHVYATSASDDSPYRRKIESGTEHFHDVADLDARAIVEDILRNEIHIRASSACLDVQRPD